MPITIKTTVSINGVPCAPNFQTVELPKAHGRGRKTPQLDVQLDLSGAASAARGHDASPASAPIDAFALRGGRKASEAEETGPVPLRNRLGQLSQRIKPQMGNLARRGLRYGIVVGGVLSSAAIMVAPVLAPFFFVPALAVSAAVPAFMLLGVLLGAVIEYVARKRRIRHVDVQDVLELERIYLMLQARKEEQGKLNLGDDNVAWHKVNAMLEELAGGFGRSLRVVARHVMGGRPPCGRYQVGSIFPQSKEMLGLA